MPSRDAPERALRASAISESFKCEIELPPRVEGDNPSGPPLKKALPPPNPFFPERFHTRRQRAGCCPANDGLRANNRPAAAASILDRCRQCKGPWKGAWLLAEAVLLKACPERSRGRGSPPLLSSLGRSVTFAQGTPRPDPEHRLPACGPRAGCRATVLDALGERGPGRSFCAVPWSATATVAERRGPSE